MSAISGYVVVRNGLRLDYCFREAISSLLPLCAEVVVCDSDSNDGTRDVLDDWARRERKLKIINMPWTNPVADVRWFVNWINYTRERLTHPWQLMLDADEVMGEQSTIAIREALKRRQPLWFKRLNFWLDSRHIAPSTTGGVQVSDCLVRFGPTNLWMPSDEPYPEDKEPEMRKLAARDDRAVIYHYGFIREDEAFKRKSGECMRIWFDTKDDRIVRATKDAVKWQNYFPLKDALIPYRGPHPSCAHEWLKEREP